MAEDGCLHFVLPDICHLRELSGFLDDGQELTSNGLNITVKGKYYQLKTEKENLQVLAPGESLKGRSLLMYTVSAGRKEKKPKTEPL